MELHTRTLLTNCWYIGDLGILKQQHSRFNQEHRRDFFGTPLSLLIRSKQLAFDNLPSISTQLNIVHLSSVTSHFNIIRCVPNAVQTMTGHSSCNMFSNIFSELKFFCLCR